MKKTIIYLITAIITIQLALATNYYFSSTGSDAGAGTSEDPYKTITKFNTLTLTAGDQVLFKCGDTWRYYNDSWLDVDHSGTAANPINYTSYGTCTGNNKPLILGSINMSNQYWLNHTGKIWYYSYKDNGYEEGLNPSFDTNADNWTSSNTGLTGAVTRTTTTTYNGAGSLKYTLNSTGDSVSDAQLYFRPFNITTGRTYKVSFYIKSNRTFEMKASGAIGGTGGLKIVNNSDGTIDYYNWRSAKNLSVNTEWKGYSYYFNASKTATNARLTFFLGNISDVPIAIYLDNVNITTMLEPYNTLENGLMVLNENSGATRERIFSNLNNQNEYHYDRGNQTTFLYSNTHPNSYYTSIEAALGEENPDYYAMTLDGRENLTIKNLNFKYFSNGGITGTTIKNIEITNNSLHWCGGNYANWSSGLMYGDCIGLGLNQVNVKILYNNVSDCSDSCITYQTWEDSKKMDNINISYNTIQRTPYGMVIFGSGSSNLARNNTVDHNTFYQIGNTYAPWTNVGGNRGIRIGSMPPTTQNLRITNNIFWDYISYGIDIGDDTTTRYDGEKPYINYNLYSGGTTYIVNNATSKYTNTTNYCTGDQQECNGKKDSTLLNETNLVPLSTGCIMSSTNSYVGSTPCIAGTTPELPEGITGLTATLISGTRITLTWNKDLNTDFDYTYIYLNEVLYNITTASTITIEGLTENMTYNVTALSAMSNGTIGTGQTIEVTTIIVQNEVMIITPTNGETLTTQIQLLYSQAVYNDTYVTNNTVEIIDKNGITTTLLTDLSSETATISLTDAEWNIGNYTIRVKAYLDGTLYSYDEVNIEIGPSPTIIFIWVYGNDSYPIDDLYTQDLTLGVDQYDNPYMNYKENYLNEDTYNVTINFTFTDLSGGYAPLTTSAVINRLTNNLSFYLTNTYINLSFWKNNISTYVNGTVYTPLYSANFTELALIYQQQFVGEGKVTINFGEIINGTSKARAQYYEYLNDGTSITDRVEMLNEANWYVYFRVLDYSDSPLKDVTITSSCSYGRGIISGGIFNWSQYLLTGQRLTQDDGYTFFWQDTGTTCIYYLYKNGYEAETRNIIVGADDEGISRDQAVNIKLKKSTGSGNANGTIVMLPKKFYDRNQDIVGNIMSVNARTVKINTTYWSQHAVGLQRINLDSYKRGTITLEPGVHFDREGEDNVTLQVFINDQYYRTYTIIYDGATKVNVISSEELENLDQGILKYILLIAVIFTSAALSLLFKSDTLGADAFKVGMIMISFISTIYLWITLIIAMGYLMKGMKKVYSE